MKKKEKNPSARRTLLGVAGRKIWLGKRGGRWQRRWHRIILAPHFTKGGDSSRRLSAFFTLFFSPEIVSDFAPVSQNDDSARGQAQKVFHVVLALEMKII